MKKPKLSIVCVSYNQENYIKQAIEGFLTQQTKFDFEIIISDDASNDSTPSIITKFAKENPHIIRHVLRKQNLGIQKNFAETLRLARGKYIAICEGDDFWTDVNKLQKQVDFLESHPKYGLCFHPVRVFFENEEEKDSVFPTRSENFSTRDLLSENFIQTNSVVYRRQKDYSNLATNVMPYDWYLHLYHTQFGKIGFINEIMASYRRHNDGAWWNARSNIDEIWKKQGLGHVALYLNLLRMYDKNPLYEKIVIKNITEMMRIFLRIDQTYETNLLETCIEKFPESSSVIVKIAGNLMTETYKNQEVLRDRNEMLQKHLSDSQKEVDDSKKVINEMISSKKYRYAQKVGRIMARLKLQ